MFIACTKLRRPDAAISAAGDIGSTIDADKRQALHVGSSVFSLQCMDRVDGLSVRGFGGALLSNACISIGTNTGVTASASRGKGQGNGAETTYSNTHVSGASVHIQSGADTTLQGAVVQGEQVSVNTGGNLHIQSLQDSASYQERSSSVGGSITVGAGFSGSINASKTKVDSDYLSVTEQSGIRARTAASSLPWVVAKNSFSAGCTQNANSDAGTLNVRIARTVLQRRTHDLMANSHTLFRTDGRARERGSFSACKKSSRKSRKNSESNPSRSRSRSIC